MNKKIIIPILICLILVTGIIGFFIWNNRTVLTITLDINPSIKINLNKNQKVKSVVAINDDAKKVISNNLRGKTLDKALKTITDNVIKEGYIEDKQVVIILYSDGNIDSNELERKVRKNFEEKSIFTEIITIDHINKEDEKIAKKYNISPAKASYINSIVNNNNNISANNLIDKSIEELKETKTTGRYCEEGYILEGDFCLKKIGEEESKEGLVCPRETREYNGTCYKEVGSEETDKLICRDEFILQDKKCVREEIINAEPEYTCTTGELHRKSDFYMIGISDAEEYYCVDKSTGEAPTLRCLTNPGHIMIGDKCANGPAPLINGGCPNGDTAINGWCYSIDDEDQWVCPDGNIYEKSKNTYVELCPDTLTYTKPTISGYKCTDDRYKLKDNKCILKEEEPAEKERICPSGYTKTESGCLDLTKKIDKEQGLVCNKDNMRLQKGKCIIYEIIEAKQS